NCRRRTSMRGEDLIVAYGNASDLAGKRGRRGKIEMDRRRVGKWSEYRVAGYGKILVDRLRFANSALGADCHVHPGVQYWDQSAVLFPDHPVFLDRNLPVGAANNHRHLEIKKRVPVHPNVRTRHRVII